tara:strand:- start:13695 stop:14312 length:618 start_codon:yes stop_codon:yes gene_type:complete
MSELFIVILSCIIGYLLGSFPTAYLVSKIKGVDVFSVGSRQAGATNVWKRVSKLGGINVFIIDVTKGSTTIILAKILGLDGIVLLIPSSFSILGHWNSPFTKFRGGDGVSTLAGISIAVAPYAVLPAFFFSGIIIILISRITLHPSLWAGIFGYSTFVILSFFDKTHVEITQVFGITLMFAAVLTHSIIFHKRHKEYFKISSVKN